ncbi:MAG: hypothetical protein IKX60_02195 [Bacteroidales bacterium]|nr:hypothetical protein [Bacteroidales bacterium]
MNIAVLRSSGKYCFRPDTTLNREARDYYLPDGVEAVILTPCIYSRVVKAGKCISVKFAGRYVDNFGFGVLLDAKDSDPLEAICLDASSFLSGETLPFSEIGNAVFEVGVNGKPVFRQDSFSTSTLIDALVTVSRRSSVRATDLLAVCLPASVVLHKGDHFTFQGRKVEIL